MYKGVDADYYGYRDDDDGTLQVVERLEEEQGGKIMFAHGHNV